MSYTLFWRPVGGGKRVGDFQLRDAIDEEFGLPCRLDAGAIPFLRGLAAAKVDGARQLIEVIEKHETVEMFKEC